MKIFCIHISTTPYGIIIGAVVVRNNLMTSEWIWDMIPRFLYILLDAVVLDIIRQPANAQFEWVVDMILQTLLHYWMDAKAIPNARVDELVNGH